MDTYCVYWIRYDSHNDRYNEGYIGVSKDPKSRFKFHRSSNPNLKLRRAISKGGRLEIIHEDLHKHEAEALEFSYRPVENIGWNLAPGGGLPPDVTGIKRSDETKLKLRNSQLGVPKSKESIMKRVEACRGKLPSGEDHPYCDKTVYTFEHPTHGTFIGTRNALWKAFPEMNINIRYLLRVAKGRAKHHKKWTAPQVLV